MLEVCGDGDPVQCLIRKLYCQDAPELLAEFFARELFGAAHKLNADDLHALGLYAAKPLDCQSHATVRLVGDGQHAACHVAVFGPQMQQGLAAPANFPGKRGTGGDAAAVFADFNGCADKEFLKAAP